MTASSKTDTKMGHTAGEWTVARSKMATDGAFDYAISAEGVPVIAEAFGRDAKGGWPNAEANARLIAAAPELLAALQLAMPALEWCDKQWANSPQRGDGINVLDVVRAAIAKATGASS